MAGEYMVEASNAAGEASTSATLHVQELSEEEHQELVRQKEEAIEKRKKREQDRIRRMEEKKRIQEETARKIREKKELLKPMKIKKVQPTIEEHADLEKQQQTTQSPTHQLPHPAPAQVTGRQRLHLLESFTQEDIRVEMTVDEVRQFVQEREKAERKLSTVEAPLIEEITPQVLDEELKKVVADKVVAETKLAVLESYTVQEISPQTTVDQLKAFIDERNEAEQVWHTVESLEVVQPAQQHISDEIRHLQRDVTVAEVKLDLADTFEVQELSPLLNSEQLQTFISERQDATRRLSVEEAVTTEQTSPEEVVHQLTHLLAVEEKSAKIKLEMLNTYSVQEVNTESTVDDTKTFIAERHEAEHVLSTALETPQTSEVSVAFVTAEIDHIQTEKAQALRHLQMVQPQAVTEMEQLLQTTVQINKFKYVTELASEKDSEVERVTATATLPVVKACKVWFSGRSCEDTGCRRCCTCCSSSLQCTCNTQNLPLASPTDV